MVGKASPRRVKPLPIYRVLCRSHEYHTKTIENCRVASKMYKEKHGVDPNLAIALDTKGPEIRTGLLEGVSNECTKQFSLLYFKMWKALWKVFKQARLFKSSHHP